MPLSAPEVSQSEHARRVPGTKVEERSAVLWLALQEHDSQDIDDHPHSLERVVYSSDGYQT